MHTITFTCETITPMFLSGADGTTPELRAPSIKGALRFWWRAMHGHLGLGDLKKVEGEIFGDTKQRSKVIIREPQEIEGGYTPLKYDNISEYPMLPHKNGRDSSVTRCFAKTSTFNIQMLMPQNGIIIEKGTSREYCFTFHDLVNLFLFVCCVGGFGKRSRRGFGSVVVKSIDVDGKKQENFKMPENIEDIYNILKTEYFALSDDSKTIISKNFHSDSKKYPSIVSIELGASAKEIEKKIINDSHLVKLKELTRIKEEDDYLKEKDGKYKINKRNEKIPNLTIFDNAIGNGGRFASPIYVSILGANNNIRSVITTLNTVPSRGNYSDDRHGRLQKEYKDRLKNIYNG